MLKRRGRLKAYTTFDYVNIFIFLILIVIMVFPFWSVVMTSLVTEHEFYNRGVILWPQDPTIKWYQFIFASDKLLRSFFVTTGVTLLGTLYSLTVTTTLSFGLSKKTLPGRGIFLTLIIITMFFGGGLIPYYMLIRSLGLVNSFWVMVLPTGINVWYFTLIKAFFNQIPESLEESAKIDGASEIVIFLRIVLPVSTPVLATFALFYGVSYWNQYYSALLFINNDKLYPLQLILRKIIVQNERLSDMAQGFGAAFGGRQTIFEEGVKMATVVVATGPILLVYPFLQRYFVKGIMLGSIKG